MRRITYTIAVIVTLTLAYIYLYIPTNWSRIKVGMFKPQVIELAGNPAFDSGDIKGCFWYFGVAPIIFQLNVYFDSEGAASFVDIKQYIGPKNGAYVREISYESK